jgi:hypothetical protein
MFATIVLPVASYPQTGAPAAAHCLAAGQMSGRDILKDTLSVKSDSGDYSDLHYDDSTVFTDGQATLSAEALNLDDRLCVEAFRKGNELVASRVLVTRRSQIDLRDRQDLLEWDRDSAFGVVKSVDVDAHSIMLQTAGGSDVLVDVGAAGEWILPPHAVDPTDAIAGDWTKLAAGDEIYVRGETASEGGVRARLVISGGFRTFIGSIESMQPLTEELRLRDFRSGRSRSMHFDFMPIYIAGAAKGSVDRRLYSGTVGDLKVGDSVLMLARQGARPGEIDALLLITGFSLQKIGGAEDNQKSDWIFKAVGFGGNAETGFKF